MSDVRPGQGRATLIDHQALRLGILRGLGRFLAAAAGPDGATICPVHGVEHTGRLAAAALIDHLGWRFTREEDVRARAATRVLRTVDQLGPDPRTGAPVFLPGGADPRDAPHAVSSGAAVDAIATVLAADPGLLPEPDAARAREAVARCVEGYLAKTARNAVRGPDRLWAAAGVAAAAGWLQRPDWAAAARQGCDRTLQECGPEGVLYLDHALAGGAALSTVHQGLLPALVLAVHDALGATPDEGTAARLGAALDVLVALRDGRGRKHLDDDARGADWPAAYEVTSHPFDAYALHRGAASLAGDDRAGRWAAEAGRAAEEWVAHLSAVDGGVESHHGRPRSLPPGCGCRLVWSADGAWLARVIADVPLHAARAAPRTIDLGGAGLLHVEREGYAALLRGAQAPGADAGGRGRGGGLLRSLVVAVDPRLPGGVERVTAAAPGEAPEASWVVRPRRGLLARVLAPSSGPAWTSHHDLATGHAFDGRSAIFTGGVADRGGARRAGAATERCYRFGDDGVELRDRLVLSGPAEIAWRVPAAWSALEVAAEGGRWSRRGDRVVVTAEGDSTTITIAGRWPA